MTSKRLLIASVLLLITALSVVTFNFQAKATEEPTPTEIPITEAPTLAPIETPTTSPSITPEATVSPTPEISTTPIPEATTPIPTGVEDEVQSSNASAPNVEVINNNNNTNNNNNEQRIYIEAPAVQNVTDGGYPVYEEPYYIEETPSTGPESLSLLGLIPTGIVGYFLRRRPLKLSF